MPIQKFLLHSILSPISGLTDDENNNRDLLLLSAEYMSKLVSLKSLSSSSREGVLVNSH